jgi:c-di-GMP-binding flagellar brake protein YcgR
MVRAEINGVDGTLYSGQLWDISRSGASISLGRNSFHEVQGSEVRLMLRSRQGSGAINMASTVRWVDDNSGATFVGMQFPSALKPGTFLDTFLNANA